MNPAAAPIATAQQTVKREWCDYNGHLNAGYYTVAFENAFFEVLEMLDLGARYVREEQLGVFTLQLSTTYTREVREGDPLAFTFQLLDHNEKLIHILMQMRHAGEDYLAAFTEQLVLHVDLQKRRAAPWPERAAKMLGEMRKAHAGLEVPAGVGGSVGIRRG